MKMSSNVVSLSDMQGIPSIMSAQLAPHVRATTSDQGKKITFIFANLNCPEIDMVSIVNSSEQSQLIVDFRHNFPTFRENLPTRFG